MPSYLVRPAQAGDAQSIAEIHVAAWQAAYTGLMPDEHLQGLSAAKRLPLWREAIEFSEPQVFVATEGDTVAGFVGFDRSRDPKSKPTTGEVWAMYVAPGHWGQGAGLALWDAAREGLLEEGCTEVTLWVLLRNERALRFYELAGFKRELNTARTTTVGGAKLEEIRLKRKLD
ncbi:MAG: GNAT family N-acetyltransferase [Ramlibacter sp.]|nr:GNAT family N-acetyltransferase [Ramlibacter sp.]